MCCCSLKPTALSLSGLVDELACPLATRDQHLTGLSFAHTHSTSCMCKYVLAFRRNFVEMPSLSVSQSVLCQSPTQPVLCRHCVSSMSVTTAPSALCNPHTQIEQRLPRAAPTPAHPPWVADAHLSLRLYPAVPRCKKTPCWKIPTGLCVTAPTTTQCPCLPLCGTT